jgi:hypothetical protein
MKNTLQTCTGMLSNRFVELGPVGFDAGDGNLYRFVGNEPTNATDPSGLEIRLYYKSATSSGGGHIEIVVWDPKGDLGEAFGGGGPGTMSSFFTLRKYTPKEGVKKISYRLDASLLKAMNDAGEIGSTFVVVKTGLTYADELKAIQGSFEKMTQIPYYNASEGPNSNTFAYWILKNAGFPTDVLGNWSARGWDCNSIYSYGGAFYDRYGNARTLAKIPPQFSENDVITMVELARGLDPRRPFMRNGQVIPKADRDPQRFLYEDKQNLRFGQWYKIWENKRILKLFYEYEDKIHTF